MSVTLKNIHFQKNNALIINEVLFCKIPKNIKVFTVFSNNLEKITSPKQSDLGSYYKENKSSSYLRSRNLIHLLNIKDKNFLSISHTKNFSAVAFSDDYKVGVDIERKDRNISKLLSNRILKNNASFELAPITLWSMMESSFKVDNFPNIHFTEYIFSFNGDLYSRKGEKNRIYSSTRFFQELSISISFMKNS